MSENLQERRLAGLTIRIERDLCIGTQSCIHVAPEVFGLDDTQTVLVLDEAPAIARERLADACASCPVNALTPAASHDILDSAVRKCNTLEITSGFGASRAARRSGDFASHMSHVSRRFSATLASLARRRPAARGSGIPSPRPKKTSSGVGPRNAACGITELCWWTYNAINPLDSGERVELVQVQPTMLEETPPRLDHRLRERHRYVRQHASQYAASQKTVHVTVHVLDARVGDDRGALPFGAEQLGSLAENGARAFGLESRRGLPRAGREALVDAAAASRALE